MPLGIYYIIDLTGIFVCPEIMGDNSITVTLSASSYTSRALRLTDRRAEWQVSWGFRSRPVDWPGAERVENRSPEANSLRTS
jgi:hypothetical protein